MLETKLGKNKIYKDVIHQTITIEYKIIEEIIQTPEFNRLRRIKQLGCSSFLFANAEHSRFQHSLGVYELTRKIVNNVPSISQEINQREKIVLMIAGLTHDVGHGPYSHTFEEIYPDFDHEAMSVRILTDKNSNIARILNKYDSNIAQEVADVLMSKHQNKLLNQIISSQIDVDRMDYLQRDSYFSGTSYGLYDLEKIIRSIRVINQEIVFESSSIYSIENFLMSRYYMFMQVYLNPRARAYELLLVELVKAGRKMGIIDIENPSQMDIEKFVLLDDNYFIYKISKMINYDDLVGLMARKFYNVSKINTLELVNKTQLKKYLTRLRKVTQENKTMSYVYQESWQATMEEFVYIPTKKPILIKSGNKIKEFSTLSNFIKRNASSQIHIQQHSLYLISENSTEIDEFEKIKNEYDEIKDELI